MNRVLITNPFIGICHMQVCAEKDVTDKEVLEICNRDNPAGIELGWAEVIRDDKDRPQNNPVQCEGRRHRHHLLVSC